VLVRHEAGLYWLSATLSSLFFCRDQGWALDSLGVALADHDHEWTVGERTMNHLFIRFIRAIRHGEQAVV